ncbi:glycerophosphoryl diester phosphodiesterase membrane domain-containing protein [Leptolyngbya sp. AN02str]|uniref:glycerophosphoryl diester phosphodiesterase membrane domain-containing protein n=1 Tax=Leptolyngbya sp. AN02str TaxID=3423363 RepID=UPI003D30F7FE
MTPGLEPQPLPQPLTIGNIVNAGFRLYTTRLKPYLKVAAIGSLWLMLPWLLAIVVAIFYATVRDYWAWLGLIIPALLVVLFMSLTRYLAESAAIARLAYGELINQPETVQAARRYTSSRKWSFFGVNMLLGLMFTAVFVAMYLLAALCVVVIFAATGGVDFLLNPGPAAAVNPGLLVLTGLIVLVVLLLLLLIASWFSVRFAIAELPLAIEPGLTATQSIGRSWNLTNRNVWRIFLVMFVTLLITLPVQLVLQIVLALVQGAIASFVPSDSPSFVLFSNLIALPLGIGVGILLLPLWQTIKAVIYYDLRSRSEGIDLVLNNIPQDGSGKEFPPV